MVKKKVTVALSDWLLSDVDDAAGEMGLSRSALIEEAAAEYVTRHAHTAAHDRASAGAREAFDDMLAFADERAADPGCADEVSSLEVLRALRGGSGEAR